MKNVAVIGGGYAGMAAAVSLAARQVPVTVYEAAAQLGGRARGVPHNGLMLDNGQHILVGAYRETLRLIAQVHPDGTTPFRRLPFQWEVHNTFRLHAPRLPAPLHMVWALLAATGTPVADRVRAARFVARMRNRGFQLEHDMTVEQLLARHGQDGALVRWLWYPLCIAALNTLPGEASAQVFLNVLSDTLSGARAASDIVLAATDLTSLFPEPAARFVAANNGRVLRSHAVSSIDLDGNDFVLHARGAIQRHTHVICAVSPHHTNRLLRQLAGLAPVADQIASLRHEPIYTVYLQFDPASNLPRPMLALPDGITQWVFDRGAICGQRGLLAAVISASGAHQHMDHPALAARVETELRQHFPRLPKPAWHFVIAEKRATFSCTQALQRPAMQTPCRNLLLAGDYVNGGYPATLEGAVRSGVASAHAILAQPGTGLA